MSDPFERAAERESLERRRRRHEGAWRRFGIHFKSYLIVNLVLALVWAVEAVVEDPEPLWFVHVVWGWGIGVLVHYVLVTRVTHEWWPKGRPSAKPQAEHPQAQP